MQLPTFSLKGIVTKLENAIIKLGLWIPLHFCMESQREAYLSGGWDGAASAACAVAHDPFRETVFGGNGQTLLFRATGFPGDVRLDKVIRRHVLQALASPL